MTTYSAIANSEIAVGAPVTNNLMTKLRDNPLAIQENDASAPDVQYAASAGNADTVDFYHAAALLAFSNHTGTIAQSQIGAVVGQGQLKTASVEIRMDGATGEVTTSSSAGRYAFAYEVFEYSGNTSDPVYSYVGIGNSTQAATSGILVQHKAQAGSGRDWWRQFTLWGTGAGSAYDPAVRELYVQSSPPYDLGDGECGLFIYALVNNNGDIMATSIAPDPFWALRGPTRTTPSRIDPETGKKYRKIVSLIDEDVVVDYEEITQEVKNRDMELLPHPFASYPSGLTPVLLDPVCRLAHDLIDLHEYGDSKDTPSSLLKSKHIIIENQPSGLKGPSSIMVPKMRFKRTGAR